jgi:hypothetical protein
MKGRLAIAAAVLAGGGAIAVTTVAASGHGATTSNSAQSAGYSLNFSRHVSMGTALNSALSSLQTNQGKALLTLAQQLTSLKSFSQTTVHHTTFAAQRGVVELANKHFLLVKSADGTQHLWWLAGTRVVNATSSTTAMMALTGSKTATTAAMTTGNMTPAATTVAGSATAASTMAAPAAKPTTITVNTGTTTITITITSTSATVSTPATTPATTASTTSTMSAAGAAATGPMVTSQQSAFTMNKGVQRGDLVLLAGLKEHGFLIAKLVLFAPPTTGTTVTPTVTPTTSTTVTPTVTPTTGATPGSLIPTHS